MNLQESGEMYLETIYILSMDSNAVRSLDVAEYMHFSKPSISRAVGILRKNGYLTTDANGHLFLPESGRAIAENIYERHTVLTRMLILLGIDEKIATEDACRIEHVISAQTVDAIKHHFTATGATDKK